jgi:DNA-binding CsgD family transcriptional regulator
MIDVSTAGLKAFIRFFDELDELIVVVDDAGLCATTNRRFQSLVGRTAEELAAVPFGSVVVGHQRLLMTAFVEWFFRNRTDLDGPQTVQFDVDVNGQPVSALFRWTMLPETEFAFVTIRPLEEARLLASSGFTMEAPFVLAAPAPLGGYSLSSPIGATSGSLTDRRAPSARPTRATLSLREREIMQLILDGNRVSTIANHLFLSENTVRNHLKRVYRKLGVGSLGELRETMRSTRRAS